MHLRMLARVLPVCAIGIAFVEGCGASQSTDEPTGVANESPLTAPAAALRPTSDIAKSAVVGVTSTTALFSDVDDTTSDDDATYVRGQANVASAFHTTGYTGSGSASTVKVVYRASQGTASGMAQVLLYDGSTLIGTGAPHSLGAWATYSDTFSGLSVTNVGNLRTKVVLTPTAGTGALRYTQIYLEVNGTGATDGGTPDSASPDAAPPPSSLCGSGSAPPTKYKHVVVLMNENRTWSTVGGVGFGSMPYLHSLAQQCTTFSSWTETNTSQNSLNQYIGLTSGISNPATVNDCNPGATCRSTDDNIFRQIRLAGGTARSFVEGATSGCSASGNAAKHIPALYYYGTYKDSAGVTYNDHDFCATEVRPLTEFDPNNLPTFAMITPNLCNDGHDCANATVDAWDKVFLPKILNSAAYAAGDTLVAVLYDEDHPVPNLLMARTAKPGINGTAGAGHAAMLKTWEEMLGLPVMKQSDLIGAISLRGPAHL